MFGMPTPNQDVDSLFWGEILVESLEIPGS